MGGVFLRLLIVEGLWELPKNTLWSLSFHEKLMNLLFPAPSISRQVSTRAPLLWVLSEIPRLFAFIWSDSNQTRKWKKNLRFNVLPAPSISRQVSERKFLTAPRAPLLWVLSEIPRIFAFIYSDSNQTRKWKKHLRLNISWRSFQHLQSHDKIVLLPIYYGLIF